MNPELLQDWVFPGAFLVLTLASVGWARVAAGRRELARQNVVSASGAAAAPSGVAALKKEQPAQVKADLAAKRGPVERGGRPVRRYLVGYVMKSSVRPSDDLPANGPTKGEAFTDKTVEMNQTSEEAVVAKSVRTVEEVVLQKSAVDRIETVRDTLRREEVDSSVVKPAGAAGTGSSRKLH